MKINKVATSTKSYQHKKIFKSLFGQLKEEMWYIPVFLMLQFKVPDRQVPHSKINCIYFDQIFKKNSDLYQIS